MSIKIIEFKAAIKDTGAAEKKLLALNPFFKGEDHQVDTYFNVATGRLKLREGSTESALIWYDRANDASSKLSNVLLYKHQPDAALKEVLTKANGIKTIVDKRRKIYFIDNVKFHFDEVKGLGKFIEVEAIDETDELGIEKIQQQCNEYIRFFDIQPEEFMSSSYSDMMLQQKQVELPALQTERLLLRAIVEEDIQKVFEGLSHPEVIKYFAISYATLEETKAQMKWYADMVANDTGRCWAICSRDGNNFYGVITLNFWNKKFRCAEMGYWIFPEYWRKGIVTEAAGKVIEYGFEQMDLHRIKAESEDDNAGSIATLKKLGFVYEGTQRECEIKDGRFISLETYAIFNNR